MNLNKTLCKYLDTEKVGYVTVGRVLEFFIFLLIMTVAVVGLLYSIYQGYLLIITGGIFDPIEEGIDGVLGCLAIIVASGIVILLICITIAVVCNIKIAKCKYKKDNQ